MNVRILKVSMAAEGPLGRLMRAEASGNLVLAANPFEALGRASADLEDFTRYGSSIWCAAVLTDFPAQASARACLRLVVALLGYDYMDPMCSPDFSADLYCDRQTPHRDLEDSATPPQFVAFTKTLWPEQSSAVHLWSIDKDMDDATTLDLQQGAVVVVNNSRLIHKIELTNGVESALFDTEPAVSWLAF